MANRLLKSLEHGFKRLAFACVSPFLRKGRTDFNGLEPISVKKVLLLRPEKLGDMIISLPVFYNLKKNYPHLELYVVASPKNIAIVRDNEILSGIFLYTKKPRRDWQMIRDLRSLDVDAVIDMICDDSVTSLFMSQFCSRRAYRIGVGKYYYRKYYDFNFDCRTGRGLGSEKYAAEVKDGHVLENTLGLLTAFGLNIDDAERYVAPTLSASAIKRAENFLAGFPGGYDYLMGLNISAGRPSRVWPDNKNIDLLGEIIDKFPESRVIISCDPKERDRAEMMAAKFDDRVRAVPEGLTLLEVAAIISKLDILITPDTAMVHLARSFKVPVVGLYTRFQINYALWQPYGQSGGTVMSNSEYNIFDIEVAAVFNMLMKTLPVKSQ